MNKVIIFMLSFIFISVFFIVMFDSVSASTLVEDSWNPKTPMQHPRYGLSVVTVEGKIYAIGGTTTGKKCVTTNEMYDPVTDTWTTLASMPTPRREFAAVACQGKIYCIGGIVATIDYETPDFPHFDLSTAKWVYTTWATKTVLSDANEVYDTSTNSWSTMAPMPLQVGYLQANVVNGYIFVLSGNSLFMYNPDTDAWIRKADIPINLRSARVGSPYPVSFVVNNTIIVAGNFEIPNSEHPIQVKSVVYDPKTNGWREEKIGPIIFCDGIALVSSGVYTPQRAYFLGAAPGSTPNEVLTNQAYDFGSNTWTIGKAISPNRIRFGAAVVDDVLYIIGGYTDYKKLGAVTLVEQYVPFGYRTIPVVEVVSPSNQLYNQSSTNLEFVVDRPVSQMYYCIDRGANVTIVGNTTLSGLPDGTHSVTVFSEDRFGNVGVSETIAFRVTSEQTLVTAIITAVCVTAVIATITLSVYFKKRHNHRVLNFEI